MAFNALLHSEIPNQFDYNTVLKSNDNMEKLNHAFDQAQRNFNIPRLLDAEDIDVDRPDEKLVLTYVSLIYHEFARRKNEMVGGKRIGKVSLQWKTYAVLAGLLFNSTCYHLRLSAS